MADASLVSSTSVSVQNNLTEPSSERMNCNAATQTPQLPRHAMRATDSNQESTQSSSFLVFRVDNQTDLTDFEKEARALAIPDVVVEYIKDTCTLTEGNNGEVVELGTTNPAFDGGDTLVRVPSSSSFKEDAKSISVSNAGSLNALHGREYEDSNGSDVGLLPIAAQNRRLYHSMPRNMAKKRLLEDYRMHSQPASPQLQRMHGRDQTGSSTSSINLLPQKFVVPPSPNFGYRPLESETSAVYTIIKTCVNTNAVRGIHFVPSITSSEKSTPRLKRKFEFAPTPEAVERKRRRLQCVTDACSLLFFIPGILLALLTPIFIVPMFIYPLSYFIILAAIFIASGTLAAGILSISGLLGNVVWHYDENSKKLRLRLHCGTGPLKHFWGNGFFYWSDEAREKKKAATVV